MTINNLNTSPLVFTIDDVLNKNLCEVLIQKTEELNYKKAPVTIDGEKGIFEMNPDVRNNTRVIVDEDSLSFSLFEKIKDFLPKVYKDVWELQGLNTRFRYYRYGVGQKFSPHIDGKYRESDKCESKLTLLIYLSEDFVGGETTFYDNSEDNLRFKVIPKLGQALIFDHHQLHSGDPLLKGIKYVLRTDVMYVKS